MNGPHSARQALHLAGSEDIRRVFRHLDDHTIASVLALNPTVAELEEAAARSAGASDVLARRQTGERGCRSHYRTCRHGRRGVWRRPIERKPRGVSAALRKACFDKGVVQLLIEVLYPK